MVEEVSARVHVSERLAVRVEGAPCVGRDDGGRYPKQDGPQGSTALAEDLGRSRADERGADGHRERGGRLGLEGDGAECRVGVQRVEQQRQHRRHERGHVTADEDRALNAGLERGQTSGQTRERSLVRGEVMRDEEVRAQHRELGDRGAGREHDDDRRRDGVGRLERVMQQGPPAEVRGQLVLPEPR